MSIKPRWDPPGYVQGNCTFIGRTGINGWDVWHVPEKIDQAVGGLLVLVEGAASMSRTVARAKESIFAWRKAFELYEKAAEPSISPHSK